ncbi:MAG TPA: DNA alkylation repair protein [Chthonomonadaceae bacterium]|nr:DNA alkylation repair protein [Chthonomonadaceae bacterium]
MTANEIIAELTPLATERSKKSWMSNGAREPCIGVKVEDMKKILKRAKGDYPLALELYSTGIADMQYLAGYITDEAKMTPKDLQEWIEAANGQWVAEFMVPWVAAETPHGREIALNWIESSDETICTAGWQTYSSLTAIKPDADLDLGEIERLLERVALSIHQRPNRVKLAMNSFVIAIGCYVVPLHALAVEVADGIGKIAVEPKGACNIPFAPDQIKQVTARRAIGKKRKTAKC